MSFAFSTYQRPIYEAIMRARARNAFIFAAASNDKHNAENPVGFPASLNEVIRVNSCTHRGFQSQFSPMGDSRTPNFSVIGEVVKAAFPLAKNHGLIETRMSGTSTATAILSGIGALVLEFSRASKIDYVDRLALVQGMRTVLFDCMAGKDPPSPPTYCHIRPWLLFDPQFSVSAVAARISDALRKCV